MSFVVLSGDKMQISRYVGDNGIIITQGTKSALNYTAIRLFRGGGCSVVLRVPFVG